MWCRRPASAGQERFTGRFLDRETLPDCSKQGGRACKPMAVDCFNVYDVHDWSGDMVLRIQSKKHGRLEGVRFPFNYRTDDSAPSFLRREGINRTSCSGVGTTENRDGVRLSQSLSGVPAAG